MQAPLSKTCPPHRSFMMERTQGCSSSNLLRTQYAQRTQETRMQCDQQTQRQLTQETQEHNSTSACPSYLRTRLHFPSPHFHLTQIKSQTRRAHRSRSVASTQTNLLQLRPAPLPTTLLFPKGNQATKTSPLPINPIPPHHSRNAGSGARARKTRVLKRIPQRATTPMVRHRAMRHSNS